MKSCLCVFNIHSGRSRNVLTVERHIEAPNWTPDGEELIVNGDGRLFRVPLDRPELYQIETGFAEQLNNDHGVSPDGEMLAISDRTLTESSCIYTLPVSVTR